MDANKGTFADNVVCEDCGREMQVGDYPFCGGKAEDHISSRASSAFFEPIVVFQAPDGTYRFPGRGDHPTPKGFNRVEINNRREAEKISRELNTRARKEDEVRRAKDAYLFEQNLGAFRAETNRLADGQNEETKAYIREMQRSMDLRDKARERYDAQNYFHVLENYGKRR